MSETTNRIMVAESLCCACSADTVRIHHEDFPEMQVEGRSTDEAVDILADRLSAALDTVADPVHRDAILCAQADVRAFRIGRRAIGSARENPAAGAR